MASESRKDENGNSTNGGSRKSFGKVISKFVDKTSMQGVVYIKDSKAITAKVVWSILLLGALVVMSLHLYLLINNFLSWPKKTTLSLGFSNLNLPAVTVCNVNVFQISKLDQTSEALKRLLDKVHPANFDQTVTSPTDSTNDDSPTVRKKRYVDDFDTLFNDTDDEYNYYDDYFDGFGLGGARDALYMVSEEFQDNFMALDRYTRISVGHDIHRMLVRCNFNGIKCYAENFTLSQSPHYGNCFTLDSSKLIVRQPGPSSGLTLVLYLRTHEYLPGITTGYGARFHLHYPNTIPFPDASGSFLEASRETHIALKQTVIQRIGQPHGVCEEGRKFKQLYGKEYNRQSCQYLCKSSTMVSECGCYDQDDDELFYSTPAAGQKVKACTKDSQYSCIFNVTLRALRKQLDCQCPDPCRETTYSLKMTTREWPTNDYSVLMRESICEDFPEDCAMIRAMDKDDLRRNFLKVKVYYEDLNHANIEEQKDIETSQFASDVGGAIGLWIGLSMLSIFEVVQLMYEILEYFFYYRLCKSSQSQTNSSATDTTYGHEKRHSSLYSAPANGHPYLTDRETKWEISPEFPSYRFYKGSS